MIDAREDVIGHVPTARAVVGVYSTTMCIAGLVAPPLTAPFAARDVVFVARRVHLLDPDVLEPDHMFDRAPASCLRLKQAIDVERMSRQGTPEQAYPWYNL